MGYLASAHRIDRRRRRTPPKRDCVNMSGVSSIQRRIFSFAISTISPGRFCRASKNPSSALPRAAQQVIILRPAAPRESLGTIFQDLSGDPT
jgi:hypothetical protein